MLSKTQEINGSYHPLCVRCWSVINGVDKDCFQWHLVNKIPFICFTCEDPQIVDSIPLVLDITPVGNVWLQTNKDSLFSAESAATKHGPRLRLCLSSKTKVNRPPRTIVPKRDIKLWKR